MTLYFDTSFLTPLIREEAASDAIRAFMAGLPAGAASVSDWTKVEFASVLAREVRMGGATIEVARAAQARFDWLIGHSFKVLPCATADFALAARYLGRFLTPLRGGDALHLAIAANNHVSMVYSLDKGLLKAGRAFGLPMSAGIAEA